MVDANTRSWWYRDGEYVQFFGGDPRALKLVSRRTGAAALHWVVTIREYTRRKAATGSRAG